MSWLVLIISGSLEAVWAAALHRSEGFRRPIPVIVFVVALALSMGGLAYSLLEIPLGTAYAVWVGVGVLLTSAYALIARVERASLGRIALLMGIAACVVGLKAVA